MNSKEKFGIGIDKNDSVIGSAVDSMAESVKNLLQGIRNSVRRLIRNVAFATQLSAAALGVIGCDKSYSRPEPDDTTQCVRTNPKDALDPPQCDSTIPAEPQVKEVAVSTSEMTIALTTTEPLTISQLVLSLDEGGIVSGLDVINEQGYHLAAQLVATHEFDIALAFGGFVPAGTSTIRLFVYGSGDVVFTTNPRDWVAQDTAGGMVELTDQELRLQFSTKVFLRVNGDDKPIVFIPFGDCVTLSWTSQDAIKCKAHDDWPSGDGSEKPTTGSEVVCPVTHADYVLQCTGLDGVTYDSVTVVPDSASSN